MRENNSKTPEKERQIHEKKRNKTGILFDVTKMTFFTTRNALEHLPPTISVLKKSKKTKRLRKALGKWRRNIDRLRLEGKGNKKRQGKKKRIRKNQGKD